MAVVSVVGLALLRLVPLRFTSTGETVAKRRPDHGRAATVRVRVPGAVGRLIAIDLLYICHWGVIVAFLPQRAEAAGADIGLFFVADGIAILLTRMPTGWLADRIRPIFLVLSGLAATAFAVLVLTAPSTTPLLIAAGTLTGTGGGLVITPLLVELSRRSLTADRGSAFALFWPPTRRLSRSAASAAPRSWRRSGSGRDGRRPSLRSRRPQLSRRSTGAFERRPLRRGARARINRGARRGLERANEPPGPLALSIRVDDSALRMPTVPCVGRARARKLSPQVSDPVVVGPPDGPRSAPAPECETPGLEIGRRRRLAVAPESEHELPTARPRSPRRGKPAGHIGPHGARRRAESETARSRPRTSAPWKVPRSRAGPRVRTNDPARPAGSRAGTTAIRCPPGDRYELTGPWGSSSDRGEVSQPRLGSTAARPWRPAMIP